MAFTELELKRCERDLGAFLARHRPPPPIRPELDFGYRIGGQSVELTEIRPVWNQPHEIQERPFAKITYVRSTRVWKLYWQRASGKWQAYDPSEFRLLENALAVIERDAYGCFFG